MPDLVFLIGLAIWSMAVGLFVLRRFGALPVAASDTIAQAIPLGLGALGLTALGLGEIGELNYGRLETVFGIGAILGAPGLLRWLYAWLRLTKAEPTSPERIERLLAALVAATLIGTLLTSLAPVTDGDALCYHLQVPKVFLEHGAVGFDPDLHETVYPLLVEMTYAVALAFRGPVACRLIQWLFGVVFALNVTALARPSLGSRAWWAGAVALLVPAISNGMSAPLNDVALAAYGTAALVAWSRFQERPGFRTAALTGVFTGLAMGVKYPALVLAGLIGIAIGPGFFSRLFVRMTGGGVLVTRAARTVANPIMNILSAPGEHAARPRRFGRFTYFLTFVAFAWLVGGCWYLRAFVHTGNPVHPFFRHAFGGAGLDEVLGAEKRPLPLDPVHLLSALGPLTLEPDKFDSFSHQFGPVFLLFLPALFLERPPRRVLAVAAFGYGFLLICLTQRQSMRFVLTAIGPLSVAVAWQARVWCERKSVPGRILLAAVMLALSFETTLALARARHGLGVVFGFVSAEEYLTRREPTFRVGRWVDEHLPPSARLVGQDHRGYYIPRPYTMELAHRRRTKLVRPGESAEEIVEQLRKDGFTHLLMCPPVPETAIEFDPALGRMLSPWLAGIPPLYREDLQDADGVTRRYAIYPLVEPSIVVGSGSSRGSLRQ